MKRFLLATLLVAIRVAAGPLSPFFLPNTGITATAIDPSNNIYIAGIVGPSDAGTIPITTGAYLPADPGCTVPSSCYQHGFVAKIASSGAVIFATYIGVVNSLDSISAIAVDSAGNVFVAGESQPIVRTPGVDSPPFGFIEKLAADGSKLLGNYTIVGGSPMAIALSPLGDVFATGLVLNFVSGFVTTTGAFQSASLGGSDAFAIHLNSTLSQLIYSTFIGGRGNDGASGITVDAAGEAYVTGTTLNAASFPVTPLGYVQPLPSPDASAVFVVKLNANGSGLIFSALFNPVGDTTGAAVAVDASGVYVAGITASSFVPLSPNAFMTTGTQFVAKLAPDGSSLLYQTLLPGPRFGEQIPPLLKIAVDASGNLLLMSHADTFAPTTPDSFAPCTASPFVSGYFVLQLNSTFSASTYGSYLPGAFAILAGGEVWYSDSSGTLNSFNIHDPLPPGVRCVADAFTGLSGPIAPGKLVRLMGPGVGSDTPATQQLDSTGKVAVGLSGVNVYFNGIAAPLLSVSATQIEAVVPFENLDPVEFPTSTVAILKNGQEIDGPPMPVVPVAPVLLTDTKGCVSGFNSDGTLNGSAHPAMLGTFIAIFGEGAGRMNPAITGGIGNGQSHIVASVTAIARNGGPFSPPLDTTVIALYAGDVPGFVEGLFQLNLLLPGSLPVLVPAAGLQTGLQVVLGGTPLNTCVWVKPAN
jgi:uncharacterized protein (TIGR03437 family)